MNPTTALTLAALLGVVALVLVVWSAVEAVLWLRDHTKRIRALEDILEDQILERALEETIEEIRLDPLTPNFLTLEHELEHVRKRSAAYRLDALEESILEEANETLKLESALDQLINELEDNVRRLAAVEYRLEEATITRHHHTPWSPLYDQDAEGVWADLTTAEEEV